MPEWELQPGSQTHTDTLDAKIHIRFNDKVF